MSKPIRVLCVDDSLDVTSMLARLMSFEPDVMCVGELSSADRLMAEVGALRPDVVLIDLTMPGRDPLGAIRELKLSGSGCRVLVFSGHDDETTKASAMAAGACGVVSKDQPYENIIGAIRAACGPV